ncbi:MAG TPA: hypothetical protein VNI84_19580 [Pyrinomonadaceae bacterium]|nr:hypothetical protein [Pyrinomonadaceae bacterium]
MNGDEIKEVTAILTKIMNDQITAMTSKERRAAEQFIRHENAKFGDDFQLIPQADYPPNPNVFKQPIRVWRNRRFVVQIFEEGAGIWRLSISRTAIDNKGNWLADIGWEDLQNIKNSVGYTECDAVEIFPAECDVVNVANMRHLWIMPEKLGFGWRKSQ